MFVYPLGLTEFHLHSPVMLYYLKVCCGITFWLFVLFSLAAHCLQTPIIFFLLSMEHLPRLEIYCHPFSTYSLNLYCQAV